MSHNLALYQISHKNKRHLLQTQEEITVPEFFSLPKYALHIIKASFYYNDTRKYIPGVSTTVRRSFTPRSSMSIVFFSIDVVFSTLSVRTSGHINMN
jgi:hypothetical protein